MNENRPLEAVMAIQSLEDCSHRVAAALQQAETHVMQANKALDALIELGSLQPTMCLGDIFYEPRTPQGAGTGRLLQAAVGIGHGGVGVVLWRADAYEQHLQSASPEVAPRGVKFSAYSDCPPELRRLLLPYLSSLLDRVIELATP